MATTLTQSCSFLRRRGNCTVNHQHMPHTMATLGSVFTETSNITSSSSSMSMTKLEAQGISALRWARY